MAQCGLNSDKLVSPPISTISSPTGSPAPSIRHAHSSNESGDQFVEVKNQKNQK